MAQGEVTSSLKCTVTVDSISQAHTENLSDHLYVYRGLVPVPPLGMVDDQIGVSHCGLDSALSTKNYNLGLPSATRCILEKVTFYAQKIQLIHGS